MPEVITIPTALLVNFFGIACPAFLIGVGVGISVYAHNLRRAGYELRFNKPLKVWRIISVRTKQTIVNE